MVTDEQKRALKDAMYLKSKGWKFEIEEDREGWVDPKTKIHYFTKDALLTQLIRDSSTNKRFGREPGAYC